MVQTNVTVLLRHRGRRCTGDRDGAGAGGGANTGDPAAGTDREAGRQSAGGVRESGVACDLQAGRDAPTALGAVDSTVADVDPAVTALAVTVADTVIGPDSGRLSEESPTRIW